jgi:hypothetical protein
MHHAILRRSKSTDQGTHGILSCINSTTKESLSFPTLELPWRDNERGKSSIPAGTYRCQYSPTNKTIGKVSRWYLLERVPGRSGILIHPGNWAGDEAKGWHSDVEGCILVGMGKTFLKVNGRKQEAITGTRDACAKLAAFFNREPFSITIRDAEPTM